MWDFQGSWKNHDPRPKLSKNILSRLKFLVTSGEAEKDYARVDLFVKPWGNPGEKILPGFTFLVNPAEIQGKRSSLG